MTEYIRKSGKSKWGHYLLKEDGKFVGTTQNVVKFLEGKLPAEVEIIESEGEGRDEKVTKVKVINTYNPTNQTKQPKSQYQRNQNESNQYNMQMSKLKNRINARTSAIENATKIAVADENLDTYEKMHEAVKHIRQEFLEFIEGGSEGENPSD